MLIRPKATNTNPRRPLPYWLLVGTSCLAMAGLLGTIATRTVHADARLQRPMAVPPPLTIVVANTTPDMSIQPSAPAKPHGRIFRGIASWYGTVFNGRKTANGETYNMYDLTACHPWLPFGSMVRVVNLRNKRSVVVRITDRSDLVNGRMIDLSYAAAEQLHMTQSGLARVSLEVLSSPGAAE